MKTNVNAKQKNTNNSFLTRSSNAPPFRISSMRSNRKAPVPLFSKNNNILSNSQDKGVSYNYYYNLMINEDLNATNTGLKSLPKTHYGSMKRK